MHDFKQYNKGKNPQQKATLSDLKFAHRGVASAERSAEELWAGLQKEGAVVNDVKQLQTFFKQDFYKQVGVVSHTHVGVMSHTVQTSSMF